MAFQRDEVMRRLHAKRQARRPLVFAGAGIGLVAKVLDRAGIDVIMAYNTGPFRMDGHGSLAGYLAYGDANAITVQLARQILPVTPATPVIGGIGAADPYRDIDRILDEYMALGFSGITNVPTAGIYDGSFRRHIDETGLGYPREVELVEKCRARGIFSIAYAFTPDEMRAMAQAGADVIGAHVGLTSGGLIGARSAIGLDEACRKTEELTRAARAERPDIFVVAHGGPFEDADAVQACFDRVDVDGFLAASTIERLPVERALTDAANSFLGLSLKG